MRFLSNFGVRYFYVLCHFWHQQDSNSLFKGGIGQVTS